MIVTPIYLFFYVKDGIPISLRFTAGDVHLQENNEFLDSCYVYLALSVNIFSAFNCNYFVFQSYNHMKNVALIPFCILSLF